MAEKSQQPGLEAERDSWLYAIHSLQDPSLWYDVTKGRVGLSTSIN